LLRTRIFGPNGNDLLAIRTFLDQIKMFCFCSDYKQTKSNCFALSQNFWAKTETICLQ
jgi:hypothetical protein